MYGDNDYPYNPQGTYSYQSSPVQPDAGGHIPKEPVRKTKKSHGGLKKVLFACGLGLCFGLFAGAGIYTVNFVAKSLTGGEETTAAPAQSQIPSGIGKSMASADPEKNGVISTNNSVTAVTTDVTEVVNKVMPSVVSITNEFVEKANFFGQTIESQNKASGSGIIVGENDKELLIVTNQHVINDAETLSVQFIDGEQAKANVKGYDSDRDLAVIAVALDDIKGSTRGSITIATLGDSDALTVGEPAIAIGNALGYGQSVTTGVISALDRELDGNGGNKLIQTDAAINPGNSGGALLNINGEVIGINSNKIGGSVVEGMGYAIPISSAKPIIEELMTKTTKDKVAEGQESFLGISGVNVTEDVSQMYGMPKGIYVAQVYEGTAAANAGLVKGDIITKFDGSTVSSMEDLQKMMQYYAAGTQVDITIQQGSPSGYQEKTVTVTLGAKADQKS